MSRKSRAVSSQGTKFYIENGAVPGDAVAITAVSKASPAVVTAAGHGLVTGSVVHLAAVQGMIELNGMSAVVGVVASDTFELVGIDSTGYTAYASGGTATPVTWIETTQHKSYSGFDGAAAEVDETTLVSVAKEKGMGLQDFGGMQVEMHKVEDDPFQVEFGKAKRAGEQRWFRLVKKNGFLKQWAGYCASLSDSGQIDGKNAATASVIINGEVFEVKPDA